MKESVLLMVLVLCVSRCSSQKGFPKQFQATFNVTTISSNGSDSYTIDNFLYDYENLRVRLNGKDDNYNKTFMIIYDPKGGETNSLTSRAYTMFGFITYNSSANDSACLYGTDVEAYLFSDFPNLYNDNANKSGIKPWFPLPSNMINKGQEWIPELQLNATRYDSQEICDLKLEGLDKVPCISYFETKDRPVKTLQAVIQQNSTLNSYISHIYSSFVRGISSEAEHLFDLPYRWPSVCSNVDAVVMIELGVTCVITPNTSANLTITLKAPPVAELGDQVKIHINRTSDSDFNAPECAKFSSVVFDKTTWNKPQGVTVSFADYGHCRYKVWGIGGGYDSDYGSYEFGVNACSKKDDDGCKGVGTCS